MYDAFLVADPSSPDADRAQAWLTKLRPCRDTTAATVPDARDGAAARTLRANDVEPATRVVLPVAPPPSAPKSPVRSMVVGALGGASLVLAGASGYMAWRANDLSGQLSASYSRGGTWNAQAAALESDGKRAQTEAIILVSTAIVAGVAAYIIHRLSN
jgi:uncharacterized iron-regulated membrane protein